MCDIFLRLLNMSFAASWLIAAVLVLRLIVRKMPGWNIRILWGLVAIRLLCPFPIESTLSVVPSEEFIPDCIVNISKLSFDDMSEMNSRNAFLSYRKLFRIYEAAKQISQTSFARFFTETSETTEYRQTVIFVLASIWTCGLSVMILYAGIMNLRLRMSLKEAVLLRDNIYLCDHVRMPFLFGLSNPRIYLPSGMDETDLKYAVAHEKAHLHGKDHIWKLTAFLLLAIYWFHPLVWAAFLLFCKDIEVACDERVIQNMGMPEKKAYAKSLVSCSFQQRTAIIYPLAFGTEEVKQRVKSILYYKKPTFWKILFSLAVCIAMGFCFLTTSPQEHQIQTMLPEDINQAQIQNHRNQNELERLLSDYDTDNIDNVSVSLQTFDNEVASAHILIENRNELTDMEQQDKIIDFVSEYLNLAVSDIYVEYIY